MRYLCFAAAVLAALPAPAQDAASRAPGISDAWARFVQRHGPAWQAAWTPSTATPRAIWGTGLRVAPGRIDDLGAARAAAERVLDDHADLLGTGASTFVEDIAVPLDRVHVFVYRQTFGGLPVIGGRADVRVHRTGVVSMFGATTVPVPADFDLRPTIGAPLADARAREAVDIRTARVEPNAGPDAELVIWADVEALAPAVPRLAWQVRVDDRSGAEPIVADVWIDARSGTVIDTEDRVYRCASGHTHVRGEAENHDDASPARSRLAGGLARRDALAAERPAAPPVDLIGNVRAWVNPGASPLDPLGNVPMPGIRVTATGVGSAFTDANGDFRIPYTGTAPVTLSVDLGAGALRHSGGGIQPVQGSAVTAQVQATPGQPAQIQLLTAGASDFDWSQTTVAWFVDDAALWLRSLLGNVAPLDRLSQVSATVNRSSSCNAFYTANSINFYAAGGQCNMTGYSSVIYHEWGHGLDNEFGGISQVDGLSEGWGDIIATYRMDDPIVGKDFTTAGGIVRSALNNKTYPPGGFPSGGAPHPKGEVFMGWAWNLRSRLIASLGRQPGIDRAEQIVVASIVGDATNQPDAVREVFLLDDDDGNLANGTPNYADLAAASRARNLPFPELQLVAIQHTDLTTTDQPLASRIVRADVRPLQGSVQSVQLVYVADAINRGTRRMLPTGNGDEYVAVLPGIISPGAMRYRIEVQHSSGFSQSYPASGDVEYRVGRLDRILFEDFEGTASGWTSSGGGNEWQLGAPRGLGGSSLGTPWSDPAQAASGTRCYGIDLGLPGDGAYEWFSNQTLTSPPIDLTGRSNATLRFSRQLSTSVLDAASLRVNGQEIWGQTDVNDTSWRTVEYSLAAFANQSNVRIEWNLTSFLPFRLGGWTIDDVEVAAFSSVPNPALQFRVLPEQIPLGGTADARLAGVPNAPLLVVFGDQPGPTTIPGIGTLAVGGNLVALPTALDAQGGLQVLFDAPTDPATRGVFTYAQALMLDGGTVRTSNAMTLLFGD